MPKASTLVDALKRELKTRDITYAELARRIEMSEASVKRMFSQKNFTLNRLDEILEATEISLRDLAITSSEDSLISELTYEQEQEIIGDTKKFIVAVSLLNLISVDQITKIYDIDDNEMVRYLTELDKIGFLELLPNNRVRLLVSRTFRWIPNGPIHTTFRQQAYAEYLQSDFDGDYELMRLINVMLSKHSVITLLNRLKQVAREFSEQHQEDAKLPFEQRYRMSFMLAARPWLPEAFKGHVRPEFKEHFEKIKKKKAPLPAPTVIKHKL
jgi:transcriptional regulator with XRE-family HTH domain